MTHNLDRISDKIDYLRGKEAILRQYPHKSDCEVCRRVRDALAKLVEALEE